MLFAEAAVDGSGAGVVDVSAEELQLAATAARTTIVQLHRLNALVATPRA